ncbi:MAG: trypsin-like peptidase domain-containing protein [Defluviitaleaceae bacterium]|nr:trypsin-like peptidase domain-containing protein [Defluviitaleaceae bacterium]
MPSPSHPQRFLRYFLLTFLAVCLGGITLVAGINAGFAAARRFIPDDAPPPSEQSAAALNAHFGPEPFTFPIAYPDFDFTHVVERVRASVVSITIESEIGGGRNNPSRTATGSGSGFIFYTDDNHAYVATNNHVVENAVQINISLDDETLVPARLVGASRNNDLAVLAVSLEALEENGVPFGVAALGDSDTLRVGDAVIAIGNALGEGMRTTQGIVSALDLLIQVPSPSTGEQLTLNVLQTDAAVNRGNSGGPLFNEHGEVVGIITAKFMGAGIEGMGYVLPIDNVRELMERLRKDGSVIIPFMGIHHDPINEEQRELFNLPAAGMLIRYVTADTPAHEAGLRRNDLIVYFGGFRTHNFEAFFEALTAHEVGETVVLGIYRGGQYMELEITLGAPR